MLSTGLILSLTLILGICTVAFAQSETEKIAENTPTDESGENPIEINSGEAESGENITENASPDVEGGKSESNVFEETYNLLRANADKIFSVLAFIGTLIVGIGYKSGLLPLLREALSKLKASLDGVKTESEATKAMTNEKFTQLSSAIDEINESLFKNSRELDRIGWQFEDYEQFSKERESMRLILLGQIDMLYAIFMSSALPQYQKDEIGERISLMREELSKYESEQEN